MNRRHFLAAASASAAALAAGCKGGSPSASSGKTLNIYTWADYIDEELVQRFEEENGCRLVFDTFDSNEAMYAKLKGGAGGYDVLVPSSYMVKTLSREGMLQKLDHAKLPNLSHVDPDHLKTALDAPMDHSVPYMAAPTGLAYLSDKVQAPATSWKMLDRADLKGRITLLDDMREVLGGALKTLGHSLNSTDPAQLAAAKEIAIGWKKNIAKFENEQYKTGLASGEFLLVHGYAGDIVQVMEENENIVFFVPEEGAPFSCDDLVIPAGATNVDLAHAFINFLTDPEVAAQNMEYIGYLAPNKDAWEKLSDETRSNSAIFPPAEVRAKCEPLDDLGDALALWSQTWDEVKSA
ncbi:MAG: spermidine/putrescine ABC transporter substrate-binding protein [Verrucomicrobiales bacterium]